MTENHDCGNVKASEAGVKGHDRQPSKRSTPEEIQAHSDEAGDMKNPKHNRPDMVHPGPDREECERSKGDAHHDQREQEKTMESEDL